VGVVQRRDYEFPARGGDHSAIVGVVQRRDYEFPADDDLPLAVNPCDARLGPTKTGAHDGERI
jgi:hypothetical protein